MRLFLAGKPPERPKPHELHQQVSRIPRETTITYNLKRSLIVMKRFLFTLVMVLLSTFDVLAAQYPISADGSVQTPTGYLCNSRFAICNNASCEVGPDGTFANCACKEMNTWNLSPIPCDAQAALTTETQLISAFTTFNIEEIPGKAQRMLTCKNTPWANCYGAVCQVVGNEVVCKCDYVIKKEGIWNTLGGNCEKNACYSLWSGSQNAQLVKDFALALKQIGFKAPIPKPCSKC